MIRMLLTNIKDNKIKKPTITHNTIRSIDLTLRKISNRCNL